MKKDIAFFKTPNFIIKKMIELNNFNKNDKILETGFGKGAFLEELNHQNFKNIYGIEYSTDFFNEVKNKFKNINLINQDYLSFQPNFLFDHIIGNPPYINSDNLDEDVKNNIRQITTSGEANIYYAFIIHSINLLKNNGSLTYILPYDFFFNTHGKKLRNFMIEKGYFTHIIDFEDTKLFKGASPETIIFRYIKSNEINKPKINIKKIKKDISLENLESNFENSFDEIFIKNFNDDNIWSLSNIENMEGIKLKDINGIKISVGIVNGSDKEFLISKEFYNTLTKNEKELYVKKFIKNIHKPKNNEFVNKFSFYIWIPNNEFKNEEDLKEKAPNIYKHLLNNKEKMIKRKLSKNKQWFDYLAIRNLSIFEDNKMKLKIHVPSLTRTTQKWFFKSNNDNYIASDLITITSNNEIKLEKIFNFLNSDIFENYYKEKGAKKGKRIVFTQKIVSEIIIPFSILEKNK